jgi:probable F420-dependent oxidoreductase
MVWSRPVARMREMVQAIKAIHRAWNDRIPLDYRGDHYRHTLMTPFFDPGPNPHGAPPIWLAGLGPRMTACAGEVADGLLIHPFHSGRFVREHVTPRATFTVSATPIVCTGQTDHDLERATEGVRRLLAFYGSTPAYRVALEPHGWGDLQPELNTLTKQGRWAETPGLITDEVLDTLAVRGQPGEIAALLEQRYRGTVDRVGLSMPYETTPETQAELLVGFRSH